MSLLDRWYMGKDCDGNYLKHDPKGCHCKECNHNTREAYEPRITTVPKYIIRNCKRNVVVYHGNRHIYDGSWNYLGTE
jgi:hypothetical protein